MLAKNNVEEEIELKEVIKEKINRLKAESQCKQDFMQEESEAFKIFSDLYCKRIKALDELNLKVTSATKR